MLHNLRIQQRFVAILLLPLVLAAGRIRLNVTEGVRAGRVNTLVIFTITLAGLAHELQKERDMSAVYVGNPSSGPQNVIVQRQLVDQVLVRYQARIGEANAGRYSERVRAALARVRQRLAGLDARRLGLADSLGWYSDTIETLIRVEDVAAGEVDNRSVAGVLAAGRLGPSDAQRLAAISALQSSWLDRFQAAATPAQRAVYSKTVTGPDAQRAASLRRNALAAEADGRPPSIELTTWFFATSAALDLLRRVQVELATATATASQASAAAADRRTATDALGIVALAVILGLSLVMAGSMARPLRQLERAAQEVAERRLPGMIERLQRGEVVDPDEEAAPLSMCSRDEIGQVARAFNEAHRVAARVATEHAALRKSIGDLFHNPARRSQGLID